VVLAGLAARGVIVDYRAPDLIRVAPIPLYNTFHEVWRFAETLREVIRDGGQGAAREKPSTRAQPPAPPS
jgi:kynureninase